jgi:hypothetical protein
LESSEEHRKQQYIGEELVRLMEVAGVMKTENENGAETSPLRTGIMVQMLQSTCNVSSEKLPLTQAALIQLCFGVIPEECRKRLVRSRYAYDNACKRSMDVFASIS